MGRKVRKQVYIESSQERMLKERARQGVGHRDDRAWKAELSFMARRATRLVAQGKRTWSREELYEERHRNARQACWRSSAIWVPAS